MKVFFLKQCKHYDGIHFIFLERVVLNDDECRSIFVGISKMNVSRKMQELVKCKFYHYLDYTSWSNEITLLNLKVQWHPW